MRATLTKTNLISFHLGHLIDFHSNQIRGWGFPPPRVQWEATYQLQYVRLGRPSAGASTTEVKCRTCGRPVTLAVRSPRTVLAYYAIIASIVIGAAIGCYAMCRDVEFACWGALGALFLATGREVLGETDHHSPAQIIADPRGGHRLIDLEM